MEVGAAFTYVFDDKEWVKKVAIGGLASFLLIVVAPIFVLQGYMLQTLKNVRTGLAAPLPEWNSLGEMIFKGAVVSILWVIYHLPVLFLLCPLLLLGLNWDQLDADVQESANIIRLSLNCLLLLFFLIGNVLFPAGLMRYAHYDRFGAALQFGEIFRFIRENLGDYAITILVSLAAVFLSLFGIIFCLIGVCVTYFIALLVRANLYGQLARKVAIHD